MRPVGTAEVTASYSTTLLADQLVAHRGGQAQRLSTAQSDEARRVVGLCILSVWM
jgi:hypothetical protein